MSISLKFNVSYFLSIFQFVSKKSIMLIEVVLFRFINISINFHLHSVRISSFFVLAFLWTKSQLLESDLIEQLHNWFVIDHSNFLFFSYSRISTIFFTLQLIIRGSLGEINVSPVLLNFIWDRYTGSVHQYCSLEIFLLPRVLRKNWNWNGSQGYSKCNFIFYNRMSIFLWTIFHSKNNLRYIL